MLLTKKTLHIPANIMSVENSLLDRDLYLSQKMFVSYLQSMVANNLIFNIFFLVSQAEYTE